MKKKFRKLEIKYLYVSIGKKWIGPIRMNPKSMRKVPNSMQVVGLVTFSTMNPKIGPVIAKTAPPMVNIKPIIDGDNSN